jgi:AcrR family transcriptional regulator
VVAGVRHVAFTRMLEGRHRELLGLTDEVLDWIGSYRLPPGGRLRTLTIAQPVRRPPAPAAFLIREDKRARVLGSVVHLTLDEGYAGLSDPQIAQFAGVSTEAFHRQFANKEECFLAVIDEFVREAIEAVRPQMTSADSWEEAVHNTIAAFVEHLAARQALLRIAFVDLFEVGPGMIGRMTRAVDEFTTMLAERGPTPHRGPLIAREAVTGALWGIISTFVSSNRLARVPALVDHLTFTVLAPYIGSKATIDVIAAAQDRRGTG